MFVQWKGTDVCVDLHCRCGFEGHFDGMFAYYLNCPNCDTTYEMPHTFVLAEVAYDPDQHEPRADIARCTEPDGPARITVEAALRNSLPPAGGQS